MRKVVSSPCSATGVIAVPTSRRETAECM
jgi:hypothetical protein